jgi:hypothetical protein
MNGTLGMRDPASARAMTDCVVFMAFASSA